MKNHSRYYFTHKVMNCYDLLSKIGSYKNQFERVLDIIHLNNTHDFQSLIYLLFMNEYDSGMLLRKNDKRLQIKICRHSLPFIIISFEMYKKHKKTSCYDNIYLINFLKGNALDIQRNLSIFILENDIILDFFKE